MAPVFPPTSYSVGSMAAATAMDIPASISTTLNAQEQGRMCGALPRGHYAHGLVRVNKADMGRSASGCFGAFPTTLTNCRGSRPGLSHSHRSVSSPTVGRCGFSSSRCIGLNSRAGASIAAARILIPIDRSRSSASGLDTLAHQQIVKRLADVLHFSKTLSLSSRLAPDLYGWSNREWRYQIQVMRCPK